MPSSCFNHHSSQMSFLEALGDLHSLMILQYPNQAFFNWCKLSSVPMQTRRGHTDQWCCTCLAIGKPLLVDQVTNPRLHPPWRKTSSWSRQILLLVVIMIWKHRTIWDPQPHLLGKGIKKSIIKRSLFQCQKVHAESACQRRRHRRRKFNPRVGKIPWRRNWQPTPVFLPGKPHGLRSVAGYSPWGRKELDTTENAHTVSSMRNSISIFWRFVSASLPLFVNCKQYTILVNWTSHLFPWFFFLSQWYMIHLIIRAVIGKHETGVHSLLPLVRLKKLQALYWRNRGQILLINVSSPLFTPVFFHQLSQIEYLLLGWEEKAVAGPLQPPRLRPTSLLLPQLGLDTTGLVTACIHF